LFGFRYAPLSAIFWLSFERSVFEVLILIRTRCGNVGPDYYGYLLFNESLLTISVNPGDLEIHTLFAVLKERHVTAQGKITR
jgi:hypothetical protein